MIKRKRISTEALDAILLPKQRKPIPHEFVLDALSALSPCTRPMFGCLAIYVKDKIVLILRDKPAKPADNGVWLATTEEHPCLPSVPKDARHIGLYSWPGNFIKIIRKSCGS